MRFLKSTRRALLAGLLLTMMAVSAAPALSAPLSADNLLRNPDFEGGTYRHNGDAAREIPNEWAPWWKNSGAAPRYNLSQASSRVKSGSNAASYWEQYQDYDGGLVQTSIAASPGTIYRFEIWGHAWSTTDTGKGTSDTDVQMQIGIDPKGGGDPGAASIVWSGTVSARDTYQLFKVETTAQGSNISVFVRGKTVYPVTQTDFYWDAGSITAVGQAAQPTATTKPGGGTTTTGGSTGGGTTGGCTSNSVPQGSIPKATPQPDGSIVHTVSRCETLTGIAVTYNVTLEQIRQLNSLKSDVLVPDQKLIIQGPTQPTAAPATATPEGGEVAEVEPTTEIVTEEPIAEPNGIICVATYEDLNQNGFREPEEPSLAGVTFAVSNSTQTVGTYTTGESSTPYCFEDLQAGDYTVSWVGEGFVGTTEKVWAAQVAPGSTVAHEFGIYSGNAPDETGDDDTSSAGGSNRLVTAALAAVGVVLFLGGLGAAGYFLLLRRTQI
jgi:LysM repeat protein